jgi:hypothetical protein
MDEKTLARLRLELEGAEHAVTFGMKTASFDTSAELDAARDLVDERRRALTLAEAQFALETREEQARLLRESLEANQTMAKASADAARWAKWAALGTAIAAAIAAFQTFRGR